MQAKNPIYWVGWAYSTVVNLRRIKRFVMPHND
jgi:hypothetical protein